MIIYLDMDGVLTDFVARVIEVTGNPKAMSELSDDEIKALASGTPDFFLNMKPLAGADKLVKACLASGQDVQILTSVGSTASAKVAEQKKKWLKKYFPKLTKFNYSTSSSKKAQYATDQTILIDDRVKSTRPFQAAGGDAILHKDASKTISALMKMLPKKESLLNLSPIEVANKFLEGKL